MKNLLAGVLAGFVAAASLSAAAAEDPLPGATLPPILELLERGNPELRALGADLDAAHERIHHAEALPDPTLNIELRDIRSRDPNLSPSQVGSTRYQIRQEFPLWGKRDLRRDRADAEARESGARRLEVRSELRFAARAAFAQYLAAAKVQRLNGELTRLQSGIEALARARYESGLAPQQDVIRAIAERTQLEGEAIVAEAEGRQAGARLNAILARPAEAPLAAPETLPPLPANGTDLAALRARLLTANPQLAAGSARVEAARSNEALVRRERYPDLTVGVAPIQTGSRFDSWDLMFEISIPLQQETRRSAEREAQAMQRAAEARREGVANALLGDLGQAWVGFDAAGRRLRLVADSLLPQAEVAFQSALAAYQNGRVDFATLLDALRQIGRTRLDLIRLETERFVRHAEIERLLGDAS
jgi:cobalt-zinc-cadmium efflux system outer membrane protein